jgi:hypothetical protein
VEWFRFFRETDACLKRTSQKNGSPRGTALAFTEALPFGSANSQSNKRSPHNISTKGQKGKGAMETQFGNFKVSFIWVETIPAIAEQQLGDKAPWRFLGMPGQFAKKWEELKASGGSPELHLPWQRPQGHHFWKYYFAGRHAGDIAGNDAWRSRVPLRSESAVKIALEPPKPAAPPGAKVTFEVFYMPQGLGLVANAYYKGEVRSANDLATLAHGVRYRYRFRMDARHAGGGMSLQSAAEHALVAVRKQAFGDVEAFAGHNQPFTIATFVHGRTDMQDVVEGSPIHRVLEALAGWDDDWINMTLDNASLERAKLKPIHRQSKGNFVYARANGRAIWLPREFTRPHPADPPRLSCYHRNLTLASLQAMSLGEYVDLAARRCQRGETVRPLLLQRARESARLLDVFGTGDHTATYRTKSVDEQINAANWRPSIASVMNGA